MANTGAQAFYDPLNPASIVEQERLARRQALVDELRSRQSAAIQQDPRGRVSGLAAALPGITQGLNGIGAALMQRKLDKDRTALGESALASRRAAFGLDPDAGPQSPIPAPDAHAGNMPPAMGTGGAPMTPMPSQDAAPAPMPPQGQPAPDMPQQPPQRGPMQLSDNPYMDMVRQAYAPEEYAKAVIAASAPTDFAKQLQQSGLVPGSPEFQQAMAAQTAKLNYVAPISGRPGSTIRDPMNPGRIVGYDAPSVEGAFPVYGENGMPTGYQQAPGYSAAVAAAETAKGLGKAQTELVQVFDPTTGQMRSVPKTAALGALGGLPTTAPLGLPQAAGQAGTNSANAFNSIVQDGQKAQDLGYTLGQIGTLARAIPGTGAGYETLNTWRSRINTAVQAAGGKPWFDNRGVANAQEIQKYVSQIAQLQSAQLGGANGSTDARLTAAFASLADVNKAPAAIQAITNYGQGVQSAVLGKAQAASQWQQQHGPETFPQFSQEFQKAYDPRIYQWRAQGPEAVAAEMKRLPPGEREKVRQKYQALKALGAFPQ